MKNSKSWSVATLATVACWMLSAGVAQAASGYVYGYLKHYQNQGNFCDDDDGRSCDGAQYLETEFNTVVPVRNAEVYVRDQNDVVIGTGTTSSTGYFNIYWYRSTMPTSASLYWTLKHAAGRFQIFSPSGATWILWTGPFTLINGGYTYIGTPTWGGPGAPHALTNVYDGAEKMWRSSLAYAGAALNGFANLDIRALSNTVPYSCSSSCALADYNIVQLDANAAYAPQARVMHEMGHIAIYQARTHRIRATADPNMLFADYCYPGTYVANLTLCNCTCGCLASGGCSGWSLTPPMATAEYRAASFEEGLATFFGDTAIYWSWSPEPYSCRASSASCTRTAANNIETSTGTTCASGETRWAISVDRYLRDMYDSVNDPGFGEAMARPYYEFFNVLAQFPDGTGNHQKDETWNASFTALDARDGRSASDDFGYNFTSLTGLTSINQYTYNCTP